MNRPLLNSILRFGLVGGFVTGMVYLLFIGLLKLGVHYLLASGAGWAAGIGISYLLNRTFTFAVPDRARPKEFGVFVGGALLQLGLGLGCYWVLMGLLGLGPTVSFVINLVFTATFSFVFMRWVVFRRRHAPTPAAHV